MEPVDPYPDVAIAHEDWKFLDGSRRVGQQCIQGLRSRATGLELLVVHDDIRELGVRECLANMPVVITRYARDEPGPTAGVKHNVCRPGMLGQPPSGGPVSPPLGMTG